jgi:hypothetical protein
MLKRQGVKVASKTQVPDIYNNHRDTLGARVVEFMLSAILDDEPSTSPPLPCAQALKKLRSGLKNFPTLLKMCLLRYPTQPGRSLPCPS